MNMQPRTLLSLFASLFLAAGPSDAQIAANPSKDEVVELSPFTVSSEKDHGYAAQETLSGTRMRTNLRDVSAAMSVLTPAFMQDLAVTNFVDALLYTPSVDTIGGVNAGSNRDAGGFLMYAQDNAYSIRGSISNEGTQAASTDFFAAYQPNDVYNLEQVTLSRGPNSILFGVGGPYGVAVSATKRALLNSSKTQTQLQADRWGSYRVTLDHNQPLLRDMLAFRINAIWGRKKEFRKFEGNDQSRLTLGLTFKPLKHTVLTVNHENYRVDRNPVPLTQAFDAGVLQWILKGRPTVDFPSQGLTWLASGHPQASFDPRSALLQRAGNYVAYVSGLNLPKPVVNLRYSTGMNSNVFGGLSANTYQTKNPWALYGIAKDANLYAGTWDEPMQQHSGQWTQAFLEQRLVEGLYLELAANHGSHDFTHDPTVFNTVQIDVDRYFVDGTLNPGYLLPYADGLSQLRKLTDEAKQYRATLSYKLDLTKQSRWFGSHNFGLLAQTGEVENIQDAFYLANRATPGLPGWNTDVLNADSRLRSRVYYIGGKVPSPLPSQLPTLADLSTINGYGTMAGATATERAPINYALEPFIPANKSKQEEKTLSLGWQAKWFADRLVTVVGYRESESKAYVGVPSRQYVDPAVADSATNPVRKYYTLARDTPYDPTPAIDAAGISRTYGAVLHATSWLDLTYNRSNNFSPPSNAAFTNYQGQPPPNSTGQTEDYGLRFVLPDGRLSVSATHFVNRADDLAQAAAVYSATIRSILTYLRANYKTPGDSHFAAMGEFGAYTPDSANASDTWAYVAQGYEVTAVFNPNKNWRLSLTGSDTTNTLGAHLRSYGQYLYTAKPYEGLATYQTYVTELRKVANGSASTYFDLNPADPVQRSKAATDATQIETLTNTAEKGYQDEIATEGVTNNRNGQYALNGVATYTLPNEGKLRGWSVGGNFRWRSAGVAGYQRKLNRAGVPEGIFDVSKPISGDTFLDVGAMIAYRRRLSNKVTMRLQLNVQNLFDWSAARLVSVDTDSQGIYGTLYAEVPVRWELRRPRNFVVTSTFEF